MPKTVVMCVRDECAGAFHRPFFVASVGVGVRSFTAEVNRSDENNPMFAYPNDFVLYELGTFDDETGRMFLVDPPLRVISANQCKHAGLAPDISGGSYGGTV